MGRSVGEVLELGQLRNRKVLATKLIKLLQLNYKDVKILSIMLCIGLHLGIYQDQLRNETTIRGTGSYCDNSVFG